MGVGIVFAEVSHALLLEIGGPGGEGQAILHSRADIAKLIETRRWSVGIARRLALAELSQARGLRITPDPSEIRLTCRGSWSGRVELRFSVRRPWDAGRWIIGPLRTQWKDGGAN